MEDNRVLSSLSCKWSNVVRFKGMFKQRIFFIGKIYHGVYCRNPRGYPSISATDFHFVAMVLTTVLDADLVHFNEPNPRHAFRCGNGILHQRSDLLLLFFPHIAYFKSAADKICIVVNCVYYNADFHWQQCDEIPWGYHTDSRQMKNNGCKHTLTVNRAFRHVFSHTHLSLSTDFYGQQVTWSFSKLTVRLVNTKPI